MPFSISGRKTPKKLLIITSSGGGGLLQAAHAKEQEARLKDPDTVIVRRDLLKDWMGRRFGRFCANSWNRAQRKGSVRAQTFFLKSQIFADYLFWPQVFFWTLYTLFSEDIDHVIDTQPIGTSAILKALRIFNRMKKKGVQLEKVLVDLPTKKATHFFRPIKFLSKKDRKHLRVCAIQPLLEEGETREQFWKRHCSLPESQVHYEDVCVRQSFRKFQKKGRSLHAMELFFSYRSLEELYLMQRSFERGPSLAKALERKVRFLIAPEDRVITILLGSQPAKEATLAYVKKISGLAEEEEGKTHLFVFAANHEPQTGCLFQKISDFAASAKNYSRRVSIIPFPFQSDEAIAPLFFRSDLTCTRSGGQTAMELMCVCSGEIWIHSESKGRGPLSLERLLKGIPGWEAENAVYLQRMRGAKIVTPESCIPLARQFFQSKASLSFPLRAEKSAF